MSVAPELNARAGLPRAGPGGAGPDARADPLPQGPGPRPHLHRAPRAHPAPAGRVPAGRPVHDAVLRPDRHRVPTERWYIGRRHVADDHGRPGRHRLAGRDVDGLLPRLARRADGRGAAPPVRPRPRPHHRLRGRAPHRPRPSTTARSQILAERDRAAPRRARCATSSRPSSPSRTRSSVRRSRPDHLRPGRTGHRQDRGRAAPRGVAALRLPRPARPLRRARHRPQPRLPRPHRRRAAGARRGGGRPHDHRGARSPAVPVRGTDRTETAVLKGDARLAEVLRRAVWSHVRRADEALVVPRGVHGSGACRRTRCNEIARRAARRGACATTRRGRCCRSGSPTRCSCRWSGPATPPTTGCRTPWRAVSRGEAVRRVAVAGARPQGRAVHRCSPTPPRSPAHADGLLDDDEQRILLWDNAPRGQGRRPVVARRRGPARRARRDHLAAHPQPRATSCSTRRRTSPRCSCARSGRRCSHRVGDRARRHRPGHDAVGDRLVGGVAAPPRQARTATSRSSTAASACRPASSSTPPGCCRSMAPGLGAPVSVRDNPGRLEIGARSTRRRSSVDRRGRRRPDERGRAWVHRRHRARRPGRRNVEGAAGQGDRPRRARARTTATSTTRSTSCRPASPRAWSSTGSSWSSRRPSPRPSPTSAPGLRRLYVVLTRAVSALTVVHAEPLPAELVQPRGWPPV